MTGAAVAGIDIALLLVVGGMLAYVVDRVLDARGWSRSSRTLRTENQDLVRRNTELEQTVARHTTTIAENDKRISDLEKQVAELQSRDQQAVLIAIERHESNAAVRHAESATRHVEALAIWGEIRDNLKGAM